MADIPESTKSEHVVWTVDATSYLRNLDSEDLHAETIAVHHQSAPEKTETGTRISLRFPTLIVSGYCSEPREVADRVARILNAHWDEPAAPPAMDREAVELDWRLVAKLAGEHGVRYRTNRAFEQFVTAILSTLSADAIRQGEGEDQDFLFDMLEALKPHFPRIAFCFARGTGGIEQKDILAILNGASAGAVDFALAREREGCVRSMTLPRCPICDADYPLPHTTHCAYARWGHESWVANRLPKKDVEK